MSDDYHFQVFGITDTGRVRRRNEDAIGWDEHVALAVLADGMGGHQAGDVASQMAVESVLSALGGPSLKVVGEQRKAIRETVSQINDAIFMRAQASDGLKGMGTTLVLLQAVAGRMLIAHVGDSRVYRLRAGKFEAMTKDHSLLNELLAKGEMSEDDIDTRFKNVLTRAIGARATVDADVRAVELRPDDVFLLCSDGLYGLLGDNEIKQVIEQHEDDKQGAVTSLINMANERGGKDNISAILVGGGDDNGYQSSLKA